MKDRKSYGTPYTIGEARLAAADVANAYHRELMQWLIRSVAELAAIVTDATANLEAKSDRAHRVHVAKLFRDRMTAVIDADSLDRALACARCDGDGEVSHGSCAVPDCEHMDPCPVCGGSGKRPTDDEIASLRLAYERAAADATVAAIEIAAFKERDGDRPHPFDEANRPACKVCGELADDEGVIHHGKGCYHLREEGGGDESTDWRPWRRWVDVDGDPMRAVAERVLANVGADPRATDRRDVEALARWVIGKTRPVPGTST